MKIEGRGRKEQERERERFGLAFNREQRDLRYSSEERMKVREVGAMQKGMKRWMTRGLGLFTC